MKKEAVGKIQPIKKSNSNLILTIIIIVLFLIVLFFLAYYAYEYFSKKTEPTETAPPGSYVNDTTPINGSNINDTSRPPVCGDGKCTGKESYANCPADCKKPTGPGGGGGGGGETCTPNCAGKQCGSDGCGGTCAPGCNVGYECNSTFNCSLIPCTNETGCNVKGLFCSGNVPYNCTNTDTDICLERTNLTVCGNEYLCANSTGCYEARNCTSNNNCTYLNNITCNGEVLINNTGFCNSNNCETNSSVVINCNSLGSYFCIGTNKYKNNYSCLVNRCVNSSVLIQNCNDSLFCNGAETCFQGICASGTLPNCNDNIGCTIDSCNELEKCNHVANNSACSTGQFCDITRGCVSNPVCPGTDDSCGIYPSCSNCSSSDNCYGSERRDYFCNLTNGCAYSIITKIENLTNNNCNNGKDDDCDGATDTDPECVVCTDTCISLGFECGNQTICGQQQNCGTCTTGTCNSTGKCIQITDECAKEQVRCVDIGGTKEYLTIQSAVNAASSGDMILVYPGTYNESVTINTEGLTLTGADPSNPPVLDGSEQSFNPAWTFVQGNIYKTPYVWKLDGVEKEHLTTSQYLNGGGGGKSEVDIQVYEDSKLLRGYKSMTESSTPGSSSGCTQKFGAYDNISYLDPSKDSWARYPSTSRKSNLQVPGRFMYDNNTNELYVSTENGDTPQNHFYNVPSIFNLMKINSANVKVKNIVFQYSSGYALVLNSAENLSFENNYMTNNQYSIMVSRGSSNLKIRNNLIQNKGWWEKYWYYDCKQGGTCGDEIGIFWSGALECMLGGASSNAEISGNVIMGYYSPIFWDCKNARIHDNIMSKYTSVINFFIYSGNDLNMSLYHNIIHDVDFGAIDGRPYGGPLFVYRNVFYKVGSIMKTGYVDPPKENYWYHNSIFGSWWMIGEMTNPYDEKNKKYMWNNIYYSKGMSDSTSQNSEDRFFSYSAYPNIITDYCLYWDQYTDSYGSGTWNGTSYSDSLSGLTNFANAIAAHNVAQSPLWKAQGEIDALTPWDIKYNLTWDWLSEMDYEDIINKGGFEQQFNLQFSEIFDKFSLQAGSPAIDAGGQAPSSWPHYPLPDTGEVTDGKPDIGAYEYQGSICADTCFSKAYECGNQQICGQSVNCGGCNPEEVCSDGICKTQSYIDPETGYEIWKMTNYSGKDYTHYYTNNVFSPDGKYIAFRTNRFPYAFMMDADGSNEKGMGSWAYGVADSYAIEPGVWSHDSNMYYFNGALYNFNLTSKQLKQISNDSSILPFYWPFLSPDGRTLFGVSNPSDLSTGYGQLKFINVDGSGYKFFDPPYILAGRGFDVTHGWLGNSKGWYMITSPGNTDPVEDIVFDVNNGNYAGRLDVNVFGDVWEGSFHHPTLSKEGYSVGEGNGLIAGHGRYWGFANTKYWIADNKTQRELTRVLDPAAYSEFNSPNVHHGNFDPSGQWIVLDCTSSKPGVLAVYPLNKSGSPKWLARYHSDSCEYNSADPHWSPDGTKIAYSSYLNLTNWDLHMAIFKKPDVPTEVAVKDIGSGKIKLTWKPASQHREIKEYEIYMADSIDGEYKKIDTVPAVYTYLETPSKIGASETTIYVDSTEGFPDSGIIEIYGLSSERPHELVSYTGKTATSFTGCTRGVLGSTAAEHYNDAFVWKYTGTEGIDISGSVNKYYKVKSLEWSGLKSDFSLGLGAEDGGYFSEARARALYQGIRDTINAGRCSNDTQIRQIISSTRSGGTAYLPEGCFEVTGEINVPQGVSVVGKGINKTILYRDNSLFQNQEDSIFFILNSNRNEISNIAFIGVNRTADVGTDKGVYFYLANNYSVHDCFFSNFGLSAVAAQKGYGVIYNSIFVDNYKPALADMGYGVLVSGFGWEDNMRLGTDQAVFIEDCAFIGSRHSVASGDGAHYVFRNNFIEGNVVSSSIDSHGPVGSVRGTRAIEVYDNVLKNPKTNFYGILPRGGGGVIFNNTIINYSQPIGLTLEAGTPPEGRISYPWLDQVKDMYIWDNRDEFGNLLIAQVSNYDKAKEYIVEGRDYFSQKKLGYVPYTYPHPLRQQTLQSPMQLQSEQASPPSIFSQIWSLIRGIFTGDVVREITGYFSKIG